MLALGLVETKGLVGAVEAADAMLKAADVHLLEKTLATGGLVTITVAGEVSAVQSAVDAAVASLARMEGVVCVSRHVIPRPDEELEHVLRLRPRLSGPAGQEEGEKPTVQEGNAASASKAEPMKNSPKPQHKARKEKE